MVDASKFKFEALGVNNWVKWSIRMKAVLVSQELWSAVDPKGASETRDDKAKSLKALALITMFVEDIHLQTVSDAALQL